MLLDDLVVLDVTQVVAGSVASMHLADLGADVLKVERPDTGDIGRSNPPFVAGRSAYFASVNRNKRSLAVDLKDDRGRDVVLDLAEAADVLVENHPPGRLEGFGLGYEAVAERNPGVVYCSITGFGQDGPYADVPALDMVAQAASGHMGLTGPPEGPPYRAGLPVGDLAGAAFAVQSVLAALLRRERTGEGAALDVSMTDALVSWLTVRAGWTFATGEAYPRTGNELREFVPYNAYPTADGHLAVIVATDRHWRRLCEALDRPGLAEDERFATVEARREHREAVNDRLAEALAERPADDWFDRLADRGVPCAPVHDTLSVWEDEQVQARDLRRDLPLDGEPFSAIAYPAQVRGERFELDRGVPDLGEHTREALAAVGYDDATVDALLEAGVVDAPEG